MRCVSLGCQIPWCTADRGRANVTRSPRIIFDVLRTAEVNQALGCVRGCRAVCLVLPQE